MPLLFIWIALLPGFLAGLAVNYFADVLPITRRLTRPLCLECKDAPRLIDYLLLRPCADCGKKQTWRHWIVLCVFTLASPLTWLHPAHRLGYGMGLVLLVYLGVVVVIDLEYRVILSEVSLAGLILGGAIGILTRGFATTFYGGLAGFGAMLVLYFFGELYTRWLTWRQPDGYEGANPSDDEVALGFGDVNLTGILGLILGWPVIVAGLLAGILAGGLASLIYILALVLVKRYRISTAIPYAPFLVLGAVVFLYGF